MARKAGAWHSIIPSIPMTTRFLVPVRRFIRNRLFEVAGFTVFAATVTIGAALATWSPSDPSFNRAIDGEPVNLLGYPGAVISDELMQLLRAGEHCGHRHPARLVGAADVAQGIARPIRSILAWLCSAILFSGFLGVLVPPPSWPLEAGLGGQTGDVLKATLLAVLTLGLKSVFSMFVAALIFAGGGLVSATAATGIGRGETSLITRIFGEKLSDWILAITGAVHHTYLGWRARAALRRQAMLAPVEEASPKLSISSSFAHLLSTLFSRQSGSVSLHRARATKTVQPQRSLA
jgi:S-DNA-T family DNA segregation ATPase FtsK/SpoIIIE